jgi:S-(hydroxymethyl)glutathione dehydrogenase/alcohol dehydrogenase
MKAAVLYEPGTPLRIEEVRLAEPREGEVKVRVAAAGVCHSDYHFMSGELSTPMPVVLGHEGAGIVESVGPGVTKVKPGDTVVLLWRASCGQCEHCVSGHPALCDISKVQRAKGGLLDGSSRLRAGDTELKHFLGVSCFAEECVVAQESLIGIPPDTPMEIAALLGCSVMTGVGAVLNTARVEPGSRVFILGAGGVGLCCVMGALVAGAGQIVVSDISVEKLQLAREFGATDVIEASGQDVVKAVRRITEGGAHYAFEAIGRPETITQAIRAVRPGGMAVQVGLAPADVTVAVSPNDLVLQEKTIKGSLYGSARPTTDIPRLLRLYAGGRLPLDRLLTGSYPLTEVNEAYQALISGVVGRCVVKPGRDEHVGSGT